MRFISIPQYEGLAIKDIANFVRPHGEVALYLPDNKEIPKLPKQWIANVCNTVLKNVFSDWVKAVVAKRNKELAIKRDLLIEMDPDLAAVYQASTKISGKFNITPRAG